jgi:hypothetical protein
MPLDYCAVPWLKRLVAGLSPRRPGFAPGSIHVGFVVDKVALGRFPPSTSVSPANIIPPFLHIHLSPPHAVCDCSDQAAHYHNLGPKLGASLLTRHIGWKQKKQKKKYHVSAARSRTPQVLTRGVNRQTPCTMADGNQKTTCQCQGAIQNIFFEKSEPFRNLIL